MIFSLVTGDVRHARWASEVLQGRILVDLEGLTKRERQMDRGLFYSDHSLDDLRAIRAACPRASITVRVNSIHDASAEEIAAVAIHRPNRIMLPWIRSAGEIERFLELVPPGIEPILLLENRWSLDFIPELMRRFPVREVFIGLNDLSLDLGFPNFQRTLLHETFRTAVRRLRESDLVWGFGGVGDFRDRSLPIAAEDFFLYQMRLGSRSGWLSRSFRRLLDGGAWQENAAFTLGRIRDGVARIAKESGRRKLESVAAFEHLLAGFGGVRPSGFLTMP
jgi:hypothetical protein